MSTSCSLNVAVSGAAARTSATYRFAARGGSWEYNAAGLDRDVLNERVQSLGTVVVDTLGDALMRLQPGLVSVDQSPRVSAEQFHEQLPQPLAAGKYVQLFEYLDQKTDVVVLTLGRIDELIPDGPVPGSRGDPAISRLPDGARRPTFWVNPRPGQDAALAKKHWTRAWLAAGMTAHPVTDGHERIVTAVRFTPMPGRERWWRRRERLRASAAASRRPPSAPARGGLVATFASAGNAIRSQPKTAR